MWKWKLLQLGVFVVVTKYLADFLEAHPESGVPPDSFAPGIYAVGAAFLVTVALSKLIDVTRRLRRS
jgi:hypothetical protein